MEETRPWFCNKHISVPQPHPHHRNMHPREGSVSWYEWRTYIFVSGIFALCSHLGYHHRLCIQKFFFRLGDITTINWGGNWAGSILGEPGRKWPMSILPTSLWPELGIWPYLEARELKKKPSSEPKRKKKGFHTASPLHIEWLHFGNHCSHLPFWLPKEQRASQANCLPSASGSTFSSFPFLAHKT